MSRPSSPIEVATRTLTWPARNLSRMSTCSFCESPMSSRGEDIGLSQKEQVDILDKFRAGQGNVLVATSIGEEGLDIPQVDLVVFYEPGPSEIPIGRASG